MKDSQFKLALVRYLYSELGYEVTEETDPFEQIGDALKGNANTSTKGKPVTRWHEAGKWALTGGESSLSPQEYKRFDENINEYLTKLNQNRADRLELRYYQYLAVLFTEIVLDRYGNGTLTDSLNRFIEETFWQFDDEVLQLGEFSKLAYWMATGSGKTHIMHINMLQAQKHFPESEYDNLILIAPTEQVADQHREGLKTNGIPCAPMGESARRDRHVLVTDINKLKRGESGPKTVDVEEYGTDNVIFVDEGHKGLGSISGGSSGWVEKRDYLIGSAAGSGDSSSTGGFAFEYSATFASSLQNERGYQEYSRSILFDYPYGRFHSDGYGKDYNILNISPDDEYADIISDEKDRWLLTNLLSHYEKVRMFEDSDIAAEHNIEKPLSVFVGNSVNAVRRGSSDVQTIVEFLSRVVRNRDGWVTSVLDSVLAGEDEYAEGGLFGDRFEYLRGRPGGAEQLFGDIKRTLYGSESATQLTATRLKNLEDEEIGLGTDSSDQYFGVVTIGDTKKFHDLIEDSENGIRTVENEVHSTPLFDRIDRERSPINFLIGSKKFAEGWDSTRPSTLGLLNIGRSEGPLVVQMFGRGVRVNGAHLDGKRADSPGYDTDRLETLDVFGVRAEYIERFKEHLKNERTEVDKNTTTVTVPIEAPGETSELKVPHRETEIDEGAIPVVSLEDTVGRTDIASLLDGTDQDDTYRVDSPLLEMQASGKKVTQSGEDSYQTEAALFDIGDFVIEQEGFQLDDMSSQEKLELLDWQYVWQSALEYKRSQGFTELIITPGGVRALFEEGEYTLKLPQSTLRLDAMDEIRRVENICVQLICQYIDTVYGRMKASTRRDKISFKQIDQDWFDTMTPDSYEITVNQPEENEGLIETLNEIESMGLGNSDDSSFSMFERKLFKSINQAYVPVFLDTDAFQDTGKEREYQKAIESKSPEGIDNDGERRFIEALEEHISEGCLSGDDTETLVMRNQSQSGYSIPKLRGEFYPDFIILIKKNGGVQHIILADPHGMVVGEKEDDIDAFRRFNERESSDDDVRVHACLFARSLGKSSLEEARRTVANSTSLNRDEFRENRVYFIDDTAPNGGQTDEEVKKMLEDLVW